MRIRIRQAAVGAVAVAMAVFVVPLAVTGAALIEAVQQQQLERTALQTAFRVGSTFVQGDPVELPPDAAQTIGLYRPDGRLTAGRGPVDGGGIIAAAAAGKVVRQQTGGDDVVAVPVVANEITIGIVRAARPASGRVTATLGLWLGLIGGAALITAAAAILADRLASRIVRPLEQLTRDARALATGPVQAEPATSSVVEVDALRAALDHGSRRVEALLLRERALASTTSHQLRTPLTALRARLEAGLPATGGTTAALLEASLDDVDRLNSIIDDLVLLARVPQSTIARSPLGALLTAAAEQWHGAVNAAGRRLQLSTDPDADSATAPAAAVRTVVDVLLDNALRHGTGTIRLTGARIGGVLTVQVDDDGQVPAEPPSNAGGIGLRLAQRTVDDLGARLLRPAAGQPARFVLLLRGEDTP